jgi:2-polyprenyl-3-methyl-5-hydroxy-6-metoxy-1,4-benzoquinol methylase
MYNQLSKHWNNYYNQSKDFGLISSQTISRFLKLADPQLPKTCLDIGCGTGQLTRELNHRGYLCHGIDVSSSAIDIARSLTTRSDELTYQQANIVTLSSKTLPYSPYSLITCKLVYAFIKDTPAFLAQVNSLLADNGIFVVITPINTGDEKPIAVNYDQTLSELTGRFKRVETFQDGHLACFICQK